MHHARRILHSALQDVRNEIMPRCSNIPLPHLKNPSVLYRETAVALASNILFIKGSLTRKKVLAALIDSADGLYATSTFFQ